MRRARLLSITIFAALLAYGALGYFYLPQASFEGDLTRMSMLPEKQFGWTRPQPPIEDGWLRQARMQDADVLVIGDSFSMSRVWQTVFTREGLRVRTEHWDNLQAVCADVVPWLRAQGFKGRYVVLEVVERNLVRVAQKSAQCLQTQYRKKHDVDGPQPAPKSRFDPDLRGHSGRMSVGLRTQLHAVEYEGKAERGDFREWQVTPEVRVMRVPDGCRLFSHRRCQDALFLTEDRPEDLPLTALQDMAAVRDRLNDFITVWAVVPNKTTAYLHPDKRFWDQSETTLHAPHLLRMVRQAIDVPTVDLYLGNNTHFSTEGYLLMGQAIRRALGMGMAP